MEFLLQLFSIGCFSIIKENEEIKDKYKRYRRKECPHTQTHTVFSNKTQCNRSGKRDWQTNIHLIHLIQTTAVRSSIECLHSLFCGRAERLVAVGLLKINFYKPFEKTVWHLSVTLCKEKVNRSQPNSPQFQQTVEFRCDSEIGKRLIRISENSIRTARKKRSTRGHFGINNIYLFSLAYLRRSEVGRLIGWSVGRSVAVISDIDQYSMPNALLVALALSVW